MFLGHEVGICYRDSSLVSGTFTCMQFIKEIEKNGKKLITFLDLDLVSIFYVIPILSY